MEAVTFIAQTLARLKPDLEVRGDGFLVKLVRLARQFDFAMKRLVRHAQQRPVRHAEAIALCGNRGAFHLYCNRAALRETLGRGRIEQLPIAIIGGDNCAGAHALLEIGALRAGDFLCRACQRLLDFGNRRNGNFGR